MIFLLTALLIWIPKAVIFLWDEHYLDAVLAAGKTGQKQIILNMSNQDLTCPGGSYFNEQGVSVADVTPPGGRLEILPEA